MSIALIILIVITQISLGFAAIYSQRSSILWMKDLLKKSVCFFIFFNNAIFKKANTWEVKPLENKGKPKLQFILVISFWEQNTITI